MRDRSNKHCITAAGKIAGIISALMICTSSAKAGPVETAVYNAAMHFSSLKRGAIACDKPLEEAHNFKSSMLILLGQVKEIERRVASSEIERVYKEDAQLGGRVCTEGLLARYNYATGNHEIPLLGIIEAIEDEYSIPMQEFRKLIRENMYLPLTPSSQK